MLEIVHDIAPGAELWFGHFETGLDFLAAVHCLAAHTDIVVDDISFLNAGLYDGTSIISANTSANLNDNANPVRAYVTDAGNFALSHYQENYSPCPSSTVQQFNATGNTVDMGAFGPQCYDPVAVGPHATLGVFLQWNDPSTGSCNDYDLYLYIHNTAVLLASSTNLQNCSQNPAESLAWVNPLGSPVLLDVVIDNPGGLANQRSLDLFTTQDAFLNFDTPGSSIPNQADAGYGVITAGAINASDPGHDTIEAYSDEGPTNDGRTKPDITGVDYVSVTGAGGFPSTFCGTSAAAPHIAGIAALLLQCDSGLKAGEPGDNPAADRANLRNVLLNNAVDLGATGPDNVYGWGRADAKASADSICQQASPSPTQSPTPTPTHSPGGGAIWGDLNCSGHVDAADAGTGLNALSGASHAAGACSAATDLDCNGQFNGADVLAILRYLVNLAIPVPGCPSIGGPAP